jgi:hypothetical protein
MIFSFLELAKASYDYLQQALLACELWGVPKLAGSEDHGWVRLINRVRG